MFQLASKRLYALSGVLVGLAIVQACSREVPPQASCNFVQNHDSQRVSWERDLPIHIYLDSSVPSEFQGAIQSAIEHWNIHGRESLGLDYFSLKGGNPGANNPSRDGYSKVYFLENWESNKSTEQARTTVYWTGTRIYEADIRVNHKNFDFYVTSVAPDYKKVHLESLIVHELGHVLGLAHTDEPSSVMQTHLANGVQRDVPSKTDLSSLSCEYSKI